MVSVLKNNKFVSDIVAWKVSHPSDNVSLFFRRKSSGERYFTCSAPASTGNRPLFISCEDLNHIFNAVDTWVKSSYVSSSITNEWGISISGGEEETDTKRQSLVFSLRNNIEAISVRNWFRKNSKEVFRSSQFGFHVTGRDNIAAFVKMKEEISKRITEVDILDGIIASAHHVLDGVYTDNYSYDAQCAPVMAVVDFEKFSQLWVEEMKSTTYPENDLGISARDIYTYVTTIGLHSLEQYIERHQYYRSPASQAQRY